MAGAAVRGRKLSREELSAIQAPEGSLTHRPIPHHEIVTALIETLSFRQIGIVRDEYAVSRDGMKMFGVLDLETSFEGCRFSIGLRNANDKSMRLALTIGYRVFVCDNMAFHGDFTPVLAKHSKHFSLVDAFVVGVDRMQRNFEPKRRQVEGWRQAQITDGDAKLMIYRAFVEYELDAPKHLARTVHELYFNPPSIRRICAAHHLEPIERIYERVQDARPDPVVQSNRQARRVPTGMKLSEIEPGSEPAYQ
jgi:hypothetical protein